MGGDEVIEERVSGDENVVVLQEGLRITLVGSGVVTSGGDPLKFATRHAELILYLLVLAGDGGLPRDELIMALWPEANPTDGRPRLRTALWQIRRTLGGHAWRLERERGVVRFSLDGVIIDAGPQPAVLGSTILVGWKFEAPPTLSERVA
jgi:DNA-binding SARP family transcriptional activator